MILDKEEFLRDLGREICKARKRQQMSQADLAEKANLSVTYISKIECGYKNFSVFTLANISQALGLSFIQLINAVCEEKCNKNS